MVINNAQKLKGRSIMGIKWEMIFMHNYLYAFYVHSEKAMAPHSSTLAWKIPWTEEPDRLQSMGSLRVGHN